MSRSGSSVLSLFQYDFPVNHDEVDSFGLLNEPRLLRRKVMRGMQTSAFDALRVKDDDISRTAALETPAVTKAEDICRTRGQPPLLG